MEKPTKADPDANWPESSALSQRVRDSLKSDRFIIAAPSGQQAKPYEPKSLTWALGLVMGMVCAISVTGIVALFLAGFGVGGFGLDPIVLASLAGGVSIQSAAAVVSPLARAIADVVIAQYTTRKGSR